MFLWYCSESTENEIGHLFQTTESEARILCYAVIVLNKCVILVRAENSCIKVYKIELTTKQKQKELSFLCILTSLNFDYVFNAPEG